MRPFVKKFVFGHIFGFCLTQFVGPLAQAQGVAPSATKNRFRLRLEVLKKSPPAQLTLSPLPINVAVPTAVGNLLVKASVAGNGAVTPADSTSPFAVCISKSCTWTASPWPFVGIGLDASTGIIHGKPTSVVQAHVQVVATEPNGKAHQSNVFISVVPTNATVITTSIPTYPAGQPIREHLIASGGAGSFIWTPLTSTDITPNITLDANGQLSGVATTAGTFKFTPVATDAAGATATSTLPLELTISAAPDCGNAKYTGTTSAYFNGWFPLSKKRNINPLGDPLVQHPTENDVQCFFGTSKLVSVVGQVQYLYGFAGGANTISADMVSVQMPSPVGTQISFGSSVTGGGTASSGTSTSATTQPTLSAALQSVEAGGDFYIHALYPIAQYTTPHLSTYLYGDPKVGFGFNGFAGQATLSQATEQYFSVPIEAYASYDGIGNTGGVFFDYRGGFESVPGHFAKAAGLSQHNFQLHQLTFGFNFVGFLKIGAQKYFGPAAAFNAVSTTDSSFNKWHFVIQFSPKGS
ncbi:hypothetical protein [Granulicella sibirica]|uniref:EF hand domain/PKD domain protein n=1 Tax=Granulicella sibirica TaxID=2479048 RepID=A0A4Q0SWG6_9BACT|nr:hypothetical protein [Granulicella sibirica]RXH55137.1 EF hand domain/PKD domain protein [Granulicella sibirica]